MEAIADECRLPSDAFAAAWDAIKVDHAVRDRLLAQAVLSLQLRMHFSFEVMPVHGLIVLEGPPGTGKTTLARGLADRVARALKPRGATFLQVDPHAMASSSLGKSQREVTRLFQQVIPERAANSPCIVLLDEVETLAADRQRLSLEANPIDVHRATDAALAGIDLLARKARNVLLLATTNFRTAVDRALLSRADWIEEIGPPGEEARRVIILDSLQTLASRWPGVTQLCDHAADFARASAGLDGRRLRKAIISAAAASLETAQDPNKLRAEHVMQVLATVTAAQVEGTAR